MARLGIEDIGKKDKMDEINSHPFLITKKGYTPIFVVEPEEIKSAI